MIDHAGIDVADVGHCAAFCAARLGALNHRFPTQLCGNEGSDATGGGLNCTVFRITRFHSQAG